MGRGTKILLEEKDVGSGFAGPFSSLNYRLPNPPGFAIYHAEQKG